MKSALAVLQLSPSVLRMVLVVSSLGMCMIYIEWFPFQIWFDSLGWVNPAADMAELKVPINSSRPLFYPFLLVVTGVIKHRSLLGLILMQASLAFLTPILVFETIRKGCPVGLSFAVAFMFLVTGTPYVMQHVLLPESVLLFLLTLSANIAAHFFLKSKRAAVLIAVIVFSFLCLVTRQNGGGMFFVFPALVVGWSLLRRPRRVLMALVAACFPCLLWLCYRAVPTTSQEPIGAMLLNQIYLLPLSYNKHEPFIDPVNGSASGRYMDLLSADIEAGGQLYADWKAIHVQLHGGCSEDQLKTQFRAMVSAARPMKEGYSRRLNALHRRMFSQQAEENSRLVIAMALETIWAHPAEYLGPRLKTVSALLRFWPDLYRDSSPEGTGRQFFSFSAARIQTAKNMSDFAYYREIHGLCIPTDMQDSFKNYRVLGGKAIAEVAFRSVVDHWPHKRQCFASRVWLLQRMASRYFLAFMSVLTFAGLLLHKKNGSWFLILCIFVSGLVSFTICALVSSADFRYHFIFSSSFVISGAYSTYGVHRRLLGWVRELQKCRGHCIAEGREGE